MGRADAAPSLASSLPSFLSRRLLRWNLGFMSLVLLLNLFKYLVSLVLINPTAAFGAQRGAHLPSPAAHTGSWVDAVSHAWPPTPPPAASQPRTRSRAPDAIATAPACLPAQPALGPHLPHTGPRLQLSGAASNQGSVPLAVPEDLTPPSLP